MCRIAGIIDFQSHPAEQLLLQMRDSMKHGGPDDAGIYMDDTWPLLFGHRRLALIDLSPGGHQPMLSPEKDIVIVFNGEIYNYQELKAELASQYSIQFRTGSDTEVIIHAYRVWGKECFNRFNGMFALAILDKQKHKVLLARDHAGIKPLYYSFKDDCLVFASEVRAFKSVKKDWPENKDWRKYFLLFGHLPEPVTTLEGVIPLKKGCVLEYDLQGRNATYFQTQPFYYNYQAYSEEEAIALVREKLDVAVQRHLISDAPIGLFLSGGLDSSILTILAKKYCGENLQTLSIDFENSKYSEKQYQDIIVKKTGARHQSFLVTQQDFESSIDDIMAAMDQPSTDGINSYFICKYAREYGLKAVLSGIGADELFGGYQSFYRASQVRKITNLPAFALAAANIAKGDKWKRISFLQRKDGLGEYLFNRGFFVSSQIAKFLDCPVQEINELLENIPFPGFVATMDEKERSSYYETNWYMQNQLLKDTDYMSMWHGIEVRVPFLDKELMQAIYSIQPELRYKILPKHLLIKAFEAELPEAIYKRPKQGFVFPFENWMKNTELPVVKNNHESVRLQKGFANGKIHWSRYWCYVLAMSYGTVMI